VNLTGESKNFKMLEFPLNQLQTYYGYLCDLCPLTAFIFSYLNYKMVIFWSQTESNPKHFFLEKKALSTATTYSECVFVALGIQLALSVLYKILPYYLINGTIFEKKKE
jgi:hypothetical protein